MSTPLLLYNNRLMVDCAAPGKPILCAGEHTYYVDHAAPDGGDGTETNPWNNINQAFNATTYALCVSGCDCFVLIKGTVDYFVDAGIYNFNHRLHFMPWAQEQVLFFVDVWQSISIHQVRYSSPGAVTFHNCFFDWQPTGNENASEIILFGPRKGVHNPIFLECTIQLNKIGSNQGGSPRLFVLFFEGNVVWDNCLISVDYSPVQPSNTRIYIFRDANICATITALNTTINIDYQVQNKDTANYQQNNDAIGFDGYGYGVLDNCSLNVAGSGVNVDFSVSQIIDSTVIFNLSECDGGVYKSKTVFLISDVKNIQNSQISAVCNFSYPMLSTYKDVYIYLITIGYPTAIYHNATLSLSVNVPSPHNAPGRYTVFGVRADYSLVVDGGAVTVSHNITTPPGGSVWVCPIRKASSYYSPQIYDCDLIGEYCMSDDPTYCSLFTCF